MAQWIRVRSGFRSFWIQAGQNSPQRRKSEETLCLKSPPWAGSFYWSQTVLWRILRRPTRYYIYDGLNKIVIKRSGVVNANIVPFYWQEWMCELAGECVHIVSDDVQLLRGESRLPKRIQKPNSWTDNFVEVSGNNLESSQTWGFCMDFLNHREEGTVFLSGFPPFSFTVVETARGCVSLKK
jgi:hypothetical protein